MAFVVDPNQQQNQPAGAPSGTSATQPVMTAGAPGSGPSGGKTPTGASNSQAPAQPFTNLQSYLSANAPQIQQQADTISGNLQNQYGQVQKDINAGTQAFGQQVAQGYTPDNPQLVQEASANPAQFVQNPSNVSQFQSLLNDQYTGPANFEGTAGYAPLNSEVTNATQNANLLSSPSGLQTYLQGTEVNPTQGENLLDSVLLNQSPQAIQQIQQADSAFSQLPAYLSSQVSAADQASSAAPANAQQAQEDAQNALNSTASGFTGTINNAVNTTQNNYTNQNTLDNAIQQAVQQGQSLTPEQAAVLGIDPNEYKAQLGIAQQANAAYNTIPANLDAYFSLGASPTPPSAATVATPDQYAEAAALEQLSGSQPLNLPFNTSNPSLAGTFNPSAGSPTFDLPSATSGLANSYENADIGTFRGYDPYPSAPINAGYPSGNIAAAIKRLMLAGADIGQYPISDFLSARNVEAPVLFGTNPDVY